MPFPKQTKKRSYHSHSSTTSIVSNGNGSSSSSTSSDSESSSCSNNNNNKKNNNSMRCTIPARIDARVTPPSDFHSQFEAKKVPTVITNIPQGFDVPPPPPLPPSSSVSKSEGKDAGKEKGDDKEKVRHKNNTKNAAEASPSSSSSATTAVESNTNEETTVHAWKALKNWNIESLSTDPSLRERPFKCGEDDDGKSIKMKLKHFIRYLQHNNDDSPLYIFDSSFEDDKVANKLLNEYRVPSYFVEDLFHLVGEKRRPPYRWFLIGPERSGTCVHIDPLATSAWNTLLVGKKRWVLFPPHIPKSVVKGTKLIRKNEDDEAIHYFTTILPRIKRCAQESRGVGKYEHFECFEFTQYENETVFIPNGWWHAVLNLTDTVGVTQNYCSQRNFDEVWVKTRTGRKKMASKWLNKLDERYPHLADRARELNRRDRFVMKYDPEEMEMRSRKKDEVVERENRERRERKEQDDLERRRLGGSYHVHKQTQENANLHQSKSNTDASYNRDAKRSRVERVVSPELN